MFNEKGQGRSRIAGLIPVVAMAVLIGFLAFFNAGGPVYNPPHVALILTLLFVLVIDIAVAFVSARAYLSSGSLNIVLLGAAILITGLSTMFALWMLDPNVPPSLTPNQAIALNNISILIGAVLLLLSAITTSEGTRTVELPRRKTILVTTYTLTFVLFVVVSALAYFNQFPVFLTSTGPTALRIAVLTATVVLVLASGLWFGLRYLQNRSSILYWYTLALALYGLDLFSAVFIVHLGDSLTWATRLALYLSSIYFLLALQSRESKIEVNAGLSERWADAFRNDREQIATFFSKMLNGFAYCKIVTDQDGKPIDYVYLDVNQAFESNHGLKKEVIIGRTATDVQPGIENDPIDLIGKYGRIALGDESADFEAFSQIENKWFHFSAYSPNKGYFISTSEDITLRKKTEEALRESEVKYRNLFDSMSEIFQLLGLIYDDRGKVIDYRYLEVNPVFERLTGRTKGQLVGHRAKELFGVVEDYWLEVYEKAVKTGEPQHFENYGAELDKYYEIFAWKAGGGQCAVIFTDITDRKRAEEKVIQSEKKYRSIGELIPFGVWTTDPQGQATYISPSFCELVGKTEEEILKYGWLDTLDPETVERTISDWKKTIESGVFWNYTHRIMGTSGQYHYVLARGVPIKDEDGKVLSWVGVNIDITEQMRNEENLVRSNAELQQFAYVASHDLQEPLRMVVSYLSLLERKYHDQLDPKAQEYIHFAVDGGERMRALINDLLEYSRVDTMGKEFAPVSMNDVVEEVVKVLKIPMEENRVDIYVGPLPTIVADESQMLQVMQNLIANAIKFHGPERPRIHVSASQRTREWTFAVRDNGIGLNTAYAEKIFLMFQRLHAKNEYPGTGVGLAVVKKIVERHGGRIWVESEEGKGATFYFTIPVRRP